MLQTVHDSEFKRRSYSHCKKITPKCCEISLLLREFRSLFVQCYGIPPEATRYMPQAGTLRTLRWKPISQPCEFNLLLRKYFAALLSVCEISQTSFFTCEMVINFVDYSLNQGAPAGHESAETPIGHESNGAVAGDRTPNQMVPLPLPLLGTNQQSLKYLAQYHSSRGGKLLETPGAIYTKPLVGRVWKVLEMPRDVHTSLHYGGRHGKSPRLSRDF
uniref:Uncharacterized protein n=1 Tax=Vitis vinifera TaxID=29760 RepID=A5C0Y7_VITVI|nr:hypothetical protein VITISV_006781 [Vitis vinifera]